MSWTQISIKVDMKDTEKASAIAHMTVPYGIYIEDYSDLEEVVLAITHAQLIEEDLLKKDKKISTIHVFISPEESPAEAVSFLSERLSFSEIKHEIDMSSVEEEDWANSWKEHFHPLKIGEKLIICPTWRTVPEDNKRMLLKIDPGMAFGTGGHETTKLVLELLEKYIADGDSVLDIGSGSGILSIGALLLGAEKTLGIDIDRLAVITAQKNGELNDVHPPRYVVKHGDLASDVEGKFDVVLANIVADAVIMLSKPALKLLKPEATFIASGIIDGREDEVVCALKSSGFDIAEIRRENGWSAVVCTPSVEGYHENL